MFPKTHDETLEDSLGSAHVSSVTFEPHLFVALECDRPLAGAVRCSLAAVDEVVLGRSTKRQIAHPISDGVRRLVIGIPGPWMSSTHARIVRCDGEWILEDLHSRNGTFIDGERVTRAPLRDGDVLELGHTLFVFRAELPTPAGTAAVHDSSTSSPPAVGMATLLPALARDLSELARIAASPVPVLLLGETGTGKEVLARALHSMSGRTGEFVAVNCGAIPPGLVEAQLFGHTKGAFSDAARDELGFVRAANGGTLLLDELGDLPLSAQPALLRVLQEREVVAVGSTRPIKVDVRVIAATHRPLEELVAAGRFRSDLLARLDGFSHRLAPLRTRREDLGILVADLMARVVRGSAPPALSPRAARALFAHDWPLNVRELEQCLLRSATLAAAGVIERSHLPPAITRTPENGEPNAIAKRTPGARSQESPEDARIRRELLVLLERHDGNLADVAREMGKARMQVHRWLKRFGIDPNTFRR